MDGSNEPASVEGKGVEPIFDLHLFSADLHLE
jgi:hypothetical protein